MASAVETIRTTKAETKTTKAEAKKAEAKKKIDHYRSKPLWTTYRVRWNFITQLCGSVPANPELVKAWLDARSPEVRPPGSRSIAEIQEEIVETIVNAEKPEEQVKHSLMVFQRSGPPYSQESRGDNLVMGSRTVRAHIKDCARILSTQHVGKIDGEKSFATNLINCVYLDESQYWIPIRNQNGEPLTKPTDERDKPIHLWNCNALKRFEFIVGAQMEFTLKVLGGNISQEDLGIVFQYGGIHGYAGERGDGEGKYTYEFL